MAGKPKYDWPEDAELVEFCGQYQDNPAAAAAFGVPGATMTSRLRERSRIAGRDLREEVQALRRERFGKLKVVEKGKPKGIEERAGLEITGDTATLVTPPAPDLGDLDTLIRDRGLDPQDWEVKNAILNEWDALAAEGAITKLRQLKVHLVRRVPLEFVRPAVGIKPHPIRKAKPQNADRVAVLFPDQHAPYHDERLHETAMRFLATIEPDEIVNLGDLGDYATISKHRDNPAWSATAQESIDSSGRILSDQRSASPAGAIKLLEGNHDWRLATELLLRAERMYGIKPAQIPGHENDAQAFSLRYLLHLDELGIEFIRPEHEGDNYEHAEYWITDTLVAIHGDKSKRAAKAEAIKVGASVVCGHTHRQIVEPISKWSRHGRQQLLAMECGTMREIDKSAGFAKRPDWHPGFGVAALYKDGTHDLEAVRWDGKYLTWRGQRFG